MIIRYHYEIGTIKRKIEEFSMEDYQKIKENQADRSELTEDQTQKLQHVWNMQQDGYANIKKQEQDTISKEMESRT